jgi:hypothetical protein
MISEEQSLEDMAATSDKRLVLRRYSEPVEELCYRKVQ